MSERDIAVSILIAAWIFIAPLVILLSCGTDDSSFAKQYATVFMVFHTLVLTTALIATVVFSIFWALNVIAG